MGPVPEKEAPREHDEPIPSCSATVAVKRWRLGGRLLGFSASMPLSKEARRRRAGARSVFRAPPEFTFSPRISKAVLRRPACRPACRTSITGVRTEVGPAPPPWTEGGNSVQFPPGQFPPARSSQSPRRSDAARASQGVRHEAVGVRYSSSTTTFLKGHLPSADLFTVHRLHPLLLFRLFI